MLLKNSGRARDSSGIAQSRGIVVVYRNFERANKTGSHSTDFHETFELSKRKRSEVYLHDRSMLQPASNRNFASVHGNGDCNAPVFPLFPSYSFPLRRESRFVIRRNKLRTRCERVYSKRRIKFPSRGFIDNIGAIFYFVYRAHVCTLVEAGTR